MHATDKKFPGVLQVLVFRYSAQQGRSDPRFLNIFSCFLLGFPLPASMEKTGKTAHVRNAQALFFILLAGLDVCAYNRNAL